MGVIKRDKLDFSKSTAFVCLSLCALCLVCAGCLKSRKSPVSKADALSSAKVSAVNGWKEVISEKGRFRIIFPSEPQAKTDESEPTQGYYLVVPGAKWYALYNDFNETRTDDEAQLRDAYQKSVQDVTKGGAKLLRQDDVYVNGRLGSEFVLEKEGVVSFMRAFVVGRRMYTLAVDSKNATSGNHNLPTDVKQFFDSFTYWD